MLCETTTRVIPRALLQQLLLLLLLVVVSFACVAVEAGVDSLVGTEGNVMPAMWYKAPGTRGQVDDAHPVNGVELSNGDYAIVGKALRCEDCPDSEGVAVVVDGSTGRTKWQWTLNSRKDDVLNAVVEVPDGSGDVLVVGYQTVGSGNNSVAKRSVTRLQGTDGTLVWTSTSFGDSQRSHGAWEMITVSDDKSTILLSGVHKRAFREEMWFKSYGNVADGQAIVMEIPVSALGAPVRAESATWTKAWTQRGMTTAKAARPVPGGGVVVLLWGDDDDSSASLQHFNANRESLWGPTRYGRAHGMLTVCSFALSCACVCVCVCVTDVCVAIVYVNVCLMCVQVRVRMSPFQRTGAHLPSRDMDARDARVSFSGNSPKCAHAMVEWYGRRASRLATRKSIHRARPSIMSAGVFPLFPTEASFWRAERASSTAEL